MDDILVIISCGFVCPFFSLCSSQCIELHPSVCVCLVYCYLCLFYLYHVDLLLYFNNMGTKTCKSI